MTLLWDNDPSSVERFSLALGGTVTRVESPQLLARALKDLPTEDLVVIGPDIDSQAACDFADACRIDRPHVGVILMRHRLDITLLASALRAGVREVLAADDITGLAGAAARSRDISVRAGSHHKEARRDGRVVTVFSAKGGVGKTTFSTNIAAQLASQGHSVLIVDLDLAFGDVAISLQMLPQNTIHDLVAMANSSTLKVYVSWLKRLAM